MLDEFYNYVSNYDMSLDGIKRKYEHSIRVMNLSIKYARLLNYSEDDIELAGIVGLLHDIGRFYQYSKYKSFNDYDLIKFAIKNHNKLDIEKTKNKRYLKFAKLIRDVDKLDIVYLTGYLGEYRCVANGDYISDKIMNCFIRKKSINRKDILNNNDNLAVSFAFVFDINNDIILKEFRQNIYYFYKRIGGINIFRDIYNCVIRYIEERTDGYVREEI